MEKDVREQAARLAASFRAKGKKVSSNVGKAVLKACLIVERDAKKSMSDSKNTYVSDFAYESAETGKIQHHGKGRSYPGNPPAVDTGRLRASITHRLEGGGYDSKTRGYVGTNVTYGRDLEFGTSRMAARPWLTPALERHREEIKRMIKDATVSGVKGQEEEAEE